MEFLSYSSSVLIRPLQLQSNADVQVKSMLLDGGTSTVGNSHGDATPQSGLDDLAKLFSTEPDRAWERDPDESAVCV